MSVVLHISDTHFGTEQAEVVTALIKLARECTPDLLVLSGDVTQRARLRQFEAARDFLDAMSVPDMLVLPGNHDIPLFNLAARVFSPYGNYRRVFGENLEPEFESPDLLVLGVNTTRPQRHTVGAVSAAQIERVKSRLLEAGPSQLRIVVLHQPVRAIRDSDIKNLLRGYEQAVTVWAAAGADVILGGHVHLPHVRLMGEVFPELPRPLYSVLAGTAVSRRVRGEVPNSVNLLRHRPAQTPRGLTVERWDFLAGRGFIMAERQFLPLRQP